MVAEPLRLVEEGKGDGDQPSPSLVLAFNDVVVQRETIIINEREYSAFVWNKRIPRSVRAQVFDAYLEARSSNNSRQYKSQLAQENCATKVLMAMIPGLSYTEADALSTDEMTQIEVRLGLRDGDNQGEPNPPPSRPRSGSTKPTGARSSSNSTPPSD